MFKKITHFIKYNNAMVLILALVFLFGTGVFAQSEAGQELIGEQETSTQGVDNTLLLELDPERLDMDFKIERITEDEDNYYATYTYLDLVNYEDAWQYQLQEKTRKISKKLRQDLGAYLAEELFEQYEARIKELKLAKEKAEETGQETRVELTAYDGLIGQTLDLAGRIFPAYEPVKAREIPSPTVPPNVLLVQNDVELGETAFEPAPADSYADIYDEYVKENDPDADDVFGVLDNCPNVYNPDQADSDGDGIGDLCEENESLSNNDNTGETATDTEETQAEDTEETPATDTEETQAEDTEETPATDTEETVSEPSEEDGDTEETAAESTTEEVMEETGGEGVADTSADNSNEETPAQEEVVSEEPGQEEPDPTTSTTEEPDVEIVEL